MAAGRRPRGSDADLDEDLQRARRIVDARRADVAPRARRRRRWRAVAVATAIATVSPVAAVIVVPDVVRQTGLPWVTDVTGSATAGNGQLSGLSCGGGYAAAIRPDQAPRTQAKMAADGLVSTTPWSPGRVI